MFKKHRWLQQIALAVSMPGTHWFQEKQTEKQQQQQQQAKQVARNREVRWVPATGKVFGIDFQRGISDTGAIWFFRMRN